MSKISESGIGIIGTSSYLPKHIQSNDELCSLIPDLTPEWILTKTGIKQRYRISEDGSASSMAITAANEVLGKTDINPREIGLIIVASFSQDYLFPPLSAKIHASIGASKDCQIIDLNTNCVGLVTALTVASERMMNDQSIKYALVVGVEVLSRFTNSTDRDTAIFFSDGAAAVMLGGVNQQSGFINAKFLTDSSTYESVRMRGGGSSFPIANAVSDPKSSYIEQNGLATWKQAVTNFPAVLQKLLSAEDMDISSVDFFIFHQANGFLIEYLMKKMKVPLNKTYTNVEEIGNTGSASIGIALDEAYSKGLIKSGSNLILAGVGAGFNFGACLFKMQ